MARRRLRLPENGALKSSIWTRRRTSMCCEAWDELRYALHRSVQSDRRFVRPSRCVPIAMNRSYSHPPRSTCAASDLAGGSPMRTLPSTIELTRQKATTARDDRP